MTKKPAKPRGPRTPHRPMPTDPKELARAMFRQADEKLFGGPATPQKGVPHMSDVFQDRVFRLEGQIQGLKMSLAIIINSLVRDDAAREAAALHL